MLSYTTHGNYKKANGYLERLLEVGKFGWLDKYGKMGVEALSNASPVFTGRLSQSWYYTIKHTKDGAILSWNNDDIENGENIAILVCEGHVTKNGYYIAPNDFVTPAIEEVFKEILDGINEEVKRR